MLHTALIWCCCLLRRLCRPCRIDCTVLNSFWIVEVHTQGIWRNHKSSLLFESHIVNCFYLNFLGLLSLKTGLIEAAKDMDESQPICLSKCPIKGHFRDNIFFCSKIASKFYNRKIVSNWFFPLFQSFCGKKIALLAGTMFPDIENEAEVL